MKVYALSTESLHSDFVLVNIFKNVGVSSGVEKMHFINCQFMEKRTEEAEHNNDAASNFPSHIKGINSVDRKLNFRY